MVITKKKKEQLLKNSKQPWPGALNIGEHIKNSMTTLEEEMRFDPSKQRVIYEPVSIETRVLVPKVIREDNRYQADDVNDGAEES